VRTAVGAVAPFPAPTQITNLALLLSAILGKRLDMVMAPT
jgi:hypothetical protein